VAKSKPSTQSDPSTPENTAEDPVFSWQLGSSKSAPHYRIFVRDLVLTGLIGIHSHEQDQPQRIRFNVDILTEDKCDATSDDIANVVSYEDVVSGIKDLLARGHVGLVETLAEEIADMCLDDGRVRVVRVRVEKLDVFDEAASVGVEIERQSRDST
jgi:dihydroneopterin aldolase|tara:strand:- start:55 stop:522 length:468 start_codon:yes stop_codon:yes gene_type:complete